MTARHSDDMHVAHTAAGWIVLDANARRPSRLCAPCHTRAEAIARRRGLRRALRHCHHDNPDDA